MAIKYRQELGRPLTYAEGDENFRTLEDSIEKTLAEYPSLSDAIAADIPDGVVFIVNDGDDEGYWRRDSSNPEGAVFLRELPESIPISQGKNMIDPSKIIFDSYWGNVSGYSSGAIRSEEGWARLPLIKVKPSTKYTISGINTAYAGNYYNSDLLRVGIILDDPVNGSLTFTTRAAASYLALNIVSPGYELGSQIQLEEGEIETEFEPYKKGIPKSEILEDIVDVPMLEQALISERLKRGGDILYNGVDAYSTLEEEYVLENDGDFFEFRVNVLDLSDNRRYALFGRRSGGNNNQVVVDKVLGYQLIRVRGNTTSWIDFPIPEFSYVNNIYRLQISNAGNTINLFENGSLIDSKSFEGHGSLSIKDVANAYSVPYTEFNLFHFALNTEQGEINSLSEFYRKASHFNIEIEEGEKVEEEGFYDTYVTYSTTGSPTGHGNFMVYNRNQNTNTYLGFRIAREVSTSKYTDQWRLWGAEYFTFDGTDMSPIGLMALTAGESESVYIRQGRDDFSGGFHGDEHSTDVRFYIDGVKILDSELDSNFNLRPCEEFSYRQISTVHTAPLDGVPEPGHPIEAIKHKQTVFKNMGYETFNRYEWQMNINDFGNVYLNLSSIAIPIGQYGEDMSFNNVHFNEDGGRKLRSRGTWLRQYNPQIGTSVVVESESNIGNDVAMQEVWDVSNYHKYYRDLNPEKDKTASVGDVWEGRTRVKFYKQK